MTREEQFDYVMNYEPAYRAAVAVIKRELTPSRVRLYTPNQQIDLIARAMQHDFGRPFTIAGCREIVEALI